MPLIRIVAVVTVLFISGCFISGCAVSTAYRPADVPEEPVASSDRVAGRVLIYTTQTDDDRVITAGATSITAAGLRLTTPVGTMVREIALKVFSEVATKGAEAGQDFTNDGRYAIVLRPQIENFDYGFPRPRLGIEIIPQVRMVLRVTLLDSTGGVMLEKDYDSGTVSGSPHVVSGKLVERTNKLAHQVMYELMRRAATDVHLFQQTQAAVEKMD
ncbi:MAG: hypothetical protein JOZ93_13095 [Sinobacteraceae bacterium]|nr:hypothetical protein [Nevskiaceae bacterium]